MDSSGEKLGMRVLAGFSRDQGLLSRAKPTPGGEKLIQDPRSVGCGLWVVGLLEYLRLDAGGSS